MNSRHRGIFRGTLTILFVKNCKGGWSGQKNHDPQMISLTFLMHCPLATLFKSKRLFYKFYDVIDPVVL